ncbi:MAG: UDP-N-acetylglucosamine 2-epimerase (non-hydrolyzing) [Pseudomonadota bacterium]
MAHLMCIFGTRPEAIKLAPVIMALRRRDIEIRVVVTGQHPDLVPRILDGFGIAADMALPSGIDPNARIAALQRAIREAAPGAVIVQGDTASTVAGAVAAGLEGVPLVHVEAGLRTYDIARPFPEELYRRAVTRLAQLHFAPTVKAHSHLLREGVARAQIHLVGNTVVDALRHMLPPPDAAPPLPLRDGRRLVIMTAHRFETSGPPMRGIFQAAARLSEDESLDVWFLAHPRLADDERAFLPPVHRVRLAPPLDYPGFLWCLRRAALVVTDSGGIQEEAAVLGTPIACIRDRTERPEILDRPAARLVGTRPARIVAAAHDLLAMTPAETGSQAFGDGHAAARIADILARPNFFATVNQLPVVTPRLPFVNDDSSDEEDNAHVRLSP